MESLYLCLVVVNCTVLGAGSLGIFWLRSLLLQALKERDKFFADLKTASDVHNVTVKGMIELQDRVLALEFKLQGK